ncbi:MAG: energy-coupling factor transporter transmembrane protein EcfT [Clostridiales bacterium]|jgi:energy-coupling factor transport system permease protein|nr:energy-coupling factor transporter transmembrane protein EcfT [Clostridiales bacterium]
MGGLLDYLPGESIIHRLNPLVKLILSFGLCVSCFLSDSIIFVLSVIVINILLSMMARVFARTLLVFLSLIKFSTLLFIIQILCVRQGEILLNLPLGLYITDKGLMFSLLFISRLIAAAMPLSLTLSVTRVVDIANVLVSKLRLPYKYAFALTAAIRFIPLFSSEMAGIMEAQTARGVDFETKNFLKKIRLLLPLCAPLLISSVRKVEGSAISAELRGFNLRGGSSGYKQYPFKAVDYSALCLCAALVVVSVML